MYRTVSRSRAPRLTPLGPSIALATPGAIADAARLIRAGRLVGFPTETVYGLGANALSAAAVQRVFRAKGRPRSDPLIVHLASAEELPRVTRSVPDAARHLAGAHWPGPLTLVLPRAEAVPAIVSAGRETVAVRVPAHPVAIALLAAADRPIAAPSANRYGHVSPTSAVHVADDLGHRVDLILDGGPTDVGIESTVLDLTADPPEILRLGGVTFEMLRLSLPNVVQRVLASQDARSPGTAMRHYAPRARVLLFPDGADGWRRALATARDIAGRCESIAVLGPDRLIEEAPHGTLLLSWGASDDAEIARRLFALLRRADSEGVDSIVAVLPPPGGLRDAVRDRLTRAASGRVIASDLT